MKCIAERRVSEKEHHFYRELAWYLLQIKANTDVKDTGLVMMKAGNVLQSHQNTFKQRIRLSEIFPFRNVGIST